MLASEGSDITCRLVNIEPSLTAKKAMAPFSASRPVFTHPPTVMVLPSCNRLAAPQSSAISHYLQLGRQQ